MSHLVFEVSQAKIEKKSTFFFLTDFVYQYTCINTFIYFFLTDFAYQYTCINTFFFFFYCFFLLIHMHKYFFFFTDLSVTGQKRKRLYEHIGNLDRLSKKGRKVIGLALLGADRSEERRVGQECRSRWSP